MKDPHKMSKAKQCKHFYANGNQCGLLTRQEYCHWHRRRNKAAEEREEVIRQQERDKIVKWLRGKMIPPSDWSTAHWIAECIEKGQHDG